MKDLYFIPKIDKHILEEHSISYDDDLDVTKGLYNPPDKSIYINLNANEFIRLLSESEDVFISALTRTIVHEYTHSIIDHIVVPSYSDMEEAVCQLMSGQRLWAEVSPSSK